MAVSSFFFFSSPSDFGELQRRVRPEQVEKQSGLLHVSRDSLAGVAWGCLHSAANLGEPRPPLPNQGRMERNMGFTDDRYRMVLPSLL